MNQPLPEDFLLRMQQQFEKDEVNSFVESFANDSLPSVRVNPAKNEERFSQYQQVPWCPHGFYLKEKPVFTLDAAFHAGAYYPQEGSSMVLWHLLEIIEKEENGRALKVLDLCGAPGGKSTLIASFLKGEGLVVANEVIQSRARILRENIIKWGAPNAVVTQSDPSAFAKLPGLFDVMVVDAPCSGEGMFRKGEVARREWSVENTRHCAVRQRRILSDSWDSLRENGWLIYSTCTFNPEENEENLKWLMDEKRAEIMKLEVPDDWGITSVEISDGNGLAFYPHKVRGEGFFVALLQKKESPRSFKTNSAKRKPVKLPQELRALIRNPDRYTYFERNELWSAFPEKYMNALQSMQKQLYLLHAGIPLGTVGRKGFVPDHALAMSWECSDNFPELELSEAEALRYLKGEPPVTEESLGRGFFLISCNRNRLGFVKNVGNRFNNLYPKEWRIRMKINEDD